MNCDITPGVNGTLLCALLPSLGACNDTKNDVALPRLARGTKPAIDLPAVARWALGIEHGCTASDSVRLVDQRKRLHHLSWRNSWELRG
jgi:hypothetical protein